MCQASPMKKVKKYVVFDSIQVHEFAPVIGDNPSVSGGVPIALGSKLIQQSVLSLDQYERERKPRRTIRELAMHRNDRKKMLLSEGYDNKDISEAIRSAYYTRKSIIDSNNNKNWDRFHEKVEATTRAITKVVGMRRSSKGSPNASQSSTASTAGKVQKSACSA